jgi:acyl carrier protein
MMLALTGRAAGGKLMSQDEVFAGFAEVLGAVAGVGRQDVTAEKSLADLGIDSLAMAEVIVAAEDRFGLIICDDDWSRFTTVGDATRYIQQARMLSG